MIRLVLMGWLGLWASLMSQAQVVDCQTIGFEDGSFGGWERWTGEFSPYLFPLPYRLEPGSLHDFNGQYGHTITSVGDGYDPNVKERIPVVAPGSRHSVRLGDLDVGGFLDQLRTSFVVPIDKPLLRYQIAVVLQNPNHRPDQQPGFSLVVRTLNGDTIRCGYYEAVATNRTAGFIYQPSDEPSERLIYRNWTSHVLDLRAYVGQTLRLEVTAHDCSEGGHFGYAYFDAQCLATSISASSVCTPQGRQIRLAAPPGFDQYLWNTGDTTATVSVSPQLGTTYWVDLQSRSVLNPSCQTSLRLNYRVEQLQFPTVQQVRVCAGESYRVEDSLYTQPGTYHHAFHRPWGCDSLLITELIVLPTPSSTQQVTLCAGSQLVLGDSVYSQSGVYLNRFVRAAPLCDSLVTTQLLIRQIDLVPPRDTLIMQGDSIQVGVNPSIGTNYTYRWSPESGLSCPTCPITWASPSQPTLYQLAVSIPSTNCQTSYPLHVDVLACLLAVPTSFTPNGDGINDSFNVVLNPCLGRIRQLSIYNRWGQLIFHQELTSSLEKLFSWDGKYKGELVQTGVYGYQLTLESPTGKMSRHTGALTVIR
ncbi:T9SS type B sorting domain-containing protein [Spirosoma endophyticum]|uniref:Gliding motility-associated C-terminal domain-containing protein n=1 Tax=Spirosoma endophyticum TaxID=662367 RepID=A0A1I2I5B8_9BACT|nr:gliding motility-associated C-terminal domain-containing protein [Spirosoma endophyticum]SFF36848.1 gliding motility-associated C-terminal domain-containing protein [Spirosoma endophyticum]